MWYHLYSRCNWIWSRNDERDVECIRILPPPGHESNRYRYRYDRLLRDSVSRWRAVNTSMRVGRRGDQKPSVQTTLYKRILISSNQFSFWLDFVNDCNEGKLPWKPRTFFSFISRAGVFPTVKSQDRWQIDRWLKNGGWWIDCKFLRYALLCFVDLFISLRGWFESCRCRDL